MTFEQFFTTATRNAAQPQGSTPYDYQRRLAEDSACQSRLIEIPTGLGKTAGVVLAWLWNRVLQPQSKWPRRLVYCLPMRTLVEQTAREVEKWIANLLAEPDELGFDPSTKESLKWLAANSPIILMGGEESDPQKAAWDIHPERPAILIGTQDMLLSRALNRGYGMSRYRWPMHFGLLNNDAFWVMDETQLMGVGLETSAQMAGFVSRFGLMQDSAFWWMSATLDAPRLKTPEALESVSTFQLADEDRSHPEVDRRLNAAKRLHRATTMTGEKGEVDFSALANEILTAHQAGTLTLVIVNIVERAQELYRVLAKTRADLPTTLLHSRFRPHERGPLMQRVRETKGDHLVISTQVIEAGVDLSARTLFTELAPWSSLVQRFGRCHRHGEMSESGADIFWIDLPDAAALPYREDEFAAARDRLADLQDASPNHLAVVPKPTLPEPPRHIVRPKDLRELFDTTPDIAGHDLDVSRFIREGDDRDASVFWRAEAPGSDAAGPRREELCAVSIAKLSDFLKKRLDEDVWVWNALDGEWQHPERLQPGREYWLLAKVGGYVPELGWDRTSKREVAPAPLPEPAPRPEAHDEDRGAASAQPETIDQHTRAVVAALDAMLQSIPLAPALAALLRRSARWHDYGKAHPVFQAGMRLANPALSPDEAWAKSGARTRLTFERRHFRHELASALAFRASAQYQPGPSGDLAAFLIAAHHGRVRLSLRSLPGETEPDDDAAERAFARGIWQGDTLPAVTIAGEAFDATPLDLACIQLGLTPSGHPSWIEACATLRDAPDLGPFRLAYLEALIRAADARGSASASQHR